MIGGPSAMKGDMRASPWRFTILAAVPACLWAADANHGATVLQEQNCLQCHTVRQESLGHEPDRAGRDLGERLAPTYSPSILASVLWNHTPEMWSSMRARGIAPPSASEPDWQDLFPYLYSL